MLDEVIIQRSRKDEYGIFGVLSYLDISRCYTLERPYHNNEPMISSIIAGRYLCKQETSVKFPYLHWRLYDVPGHKDILIHRGNTIIDTHGCILVGKKTNDKGIERSKDALDELVKDLPKEFYLVIKD